MKNYPGNKKINGFYHKIINQIPKHKTFHEVFSGKAAISKLLLEKGSDAAIHLNDLDIDVLEELIFEVEHANISNVRALEYIKKLKAAGTDEVAFMDPPYLHSTRPYSTKLYKHEMTDADHKQLLSSVLQLKCNVMIVHPVCDLYDNWLKGWRKVFVKVRYHNKTSLECLYMNYDEPTVLQTDAYLGKDCWDRQRIKRKADSLVSKLLGLPKLERDFVIKRVLDNVA